MRGVVLDSREKEATSVVLLDDGRIEVVQKYYTVGEEIDLNSKSVRPKAVIYMWQRAVVAAAVLLLVFGLASPRITYASVTVDGVKYGVNIYNQVISMSAVDGSEETQAFVRENKDAYTRESLDDVLDDVADKMLAENRDTLEYEVEGPAGMQEKLKERADDYKERFEEKQKSEMSMADEQANTSGQASQGDPGNAGSQGGMISPGEAGDVTVPGSQDVNGQSAQGANGQEAQASNGQNAQGADGQGAQAVNGQNAQASNGQSAGKDTAGASRESDAQSTQGTDAPSLQNASPSDGRTAEAQGSAGNAGGNMQGSNDNGRASENGMYGGGQQAGGGAAGGGNPGGAGPG